MDDPSQHGTNARVLSFLLQPENNEYCKLPADNTAALHFIAADPGISVLLDVGAQMLTHSNVELVTEWLRHRKDVNAAVFFIDDELQVSTREGLIQPFRSSPFNRRLDECVVYLDDAHTRGTDLKLPRNARAGVTLGPKVTKDRLVQGGSLILSLISYSSLMPYLTGCMRLRQLGHCQSVKFFAPEIVDRQIQEMRSQDTSPPLEPPGSFDVLRWVIAETCADLLHNVPHWLKQGVDYENRRSAWNDYNQEGDDGAPFDLGVLKRYWVQPEAKTLSGMYWRPVGEAADLIGPAHPNADIPTIVQRYHDLGLVATSAPDTRLEEEQEGQ